MRWILSLIVFFTAAYAEELKNPVSEDLAHLLWHVMKSYEGEYDFQQLLHTLSKLNQSQIKEKPLEQCYTSLLDVLEKKASAQAQHNLQIADGFLEELSRMPGINEVVKHRLYYKTMQPGKGEPINDFNHSPLISFKEKTLSGEILSQHAKIKIPLSETISGLQKGLKGIRVGETRQIFIHPDFAYKDFPKPEPYSLIILEVTLIAL